MGNLNRKTDKVLDTHKIHEYLRTFMPFVVIKWNNIDVYGRQNLVAFGFHTFQRLK